MCVIHVSVLQLAKRLPPHFVPAEEYDALREEFMEYAVATDADLPAMDDGVDAFWSAMASLKTGAGHYKYSTISKRMKTYLLLPHSNAGSDFGACVLDGEQNLHRASCGFGARHGRRPSVCEGEFACGSAAIRTFQE